MVAAKIAASSPSPVHAADASDDVLELIWTRDLPREHGFEPMRVEGTLPSGLRGTLYRNGPGLFGQHGKRYSHAFEGDGAATAIRIAEGTATSASRVHASAQLVEERAAGEILYNLSAPWLRRVRNMFRGVRKNTANTNIFSWQDRVFALMEAGRPMEVDPRDLSTLGETDLGVIGAAFSAHPHRVDARKASYNFGLSYGRVTQLCLYELPDVGPARKLGEVPLAGPPMLHDFIATDTHLVFFVSPTRIDLPRMMLQLGGFADLFKWRPEHGTEVICVPIDRPSEVVRFTTEAFYQWHFGNAFTRGGELVIDYVRYPNFDSFYDIGSFATGQGRDPIHAGRLHRATIELATRTLRSEPLADRSCEFPTVARGREGRIHDRTFVTFDGLRALGSIDARGAVVSHELPVGELATEPVWAEGHLLSLCHTRDRAYVGVYDAARIPDGPVAKIWLEHHVPITFHGSFAPTR